VVSGANRPGRGAGTAGPGSIVDDGNSGILQVETRGGAATIRVPSKVATEECLMSAAGQQMAV